MEFGDIFEAEYRNVELSLSREQVEDFAKKLIAEGYSVGWKLGTEKVVLHIISKAERGALPESLPFKPKKERLCFASDFCVRDKKVMDVLETLIADERGHAVIRKFSARNVTTYNVAFGETVKITQSGGSQSTLVFEKQNAVSVEDVVNAIKNTHSVIRRASALRMEIDYELAFLDEWIKADKKRKIKSSKARLEQLRRELISTETLPWKSV